MGRKIKAGEKIVYFRPVDAGKTETRYRKGESKSYQVKVYDKMYFEKEDILGLKFKGEVFPIGNNANFTIIHNYILHVWSYFLGKDATYTYIQLRSYDFGGKAITTVSKKRLMEILGVKDATTVSKYMKPLEDYDFAYMFQSESSIDGEQKGSVFVVRSTVPVLPEELYEKLPPNIKKEADRLVSKITKNTVLEVEDDEDSTDPLESSGIVDEIKTKDISDKAVKDSSPNITKVVESVMAQLKSIHSETSYNTWFKGYLPNTRYEEGNIIITVANKFTKELYETRYLAQLKELFKLHISYKDIQVVAE